MISPTGNDPHPQRLPVGFTLLELMVVLLILTFLLGFSAPLFSRTFSQLKLEVFSYNIAKLLHYAGKRAVAYRNRVRVHFDAEHKQYWLLEAQESSPESEFQRIHDRPGRVYSVPDGIFLEPSTYEVTFYPDGRADRFQLMILDDRQTRYRLETNVWNGRISLFTLD